MFVISSVLTSLSVGIVLTAAGITAGVVSGLDGVACVDMIDGVDGIDGIVVMAGLDDVAGIDVAVDGWLVAVVGLLTSSSKGSGGDEDSAAAIPEVNTNFSCSSMALNLFRISSNWRF